jgi:CO/xanthine dehydrogenase FAD-binding subunit
MKIASIIFALLFVVIECNANQELTNKARILINAYSQQNYELAAEQVYCPPSLGPEKTKLKRAELANEIELLAKDYGKPISMKEFESGTFTFITLVCAKGEHLSKSIIGENKIAITHDDKKQSMLELRYVSIDDKAVIGMISIGEIGISPSTIKSTKEKWDSL